MDVDRRNWLAHMVEGGLFMGGLAMVNAQTLLPSVVQGLRGPEWLVALMPVLMLAGFMIPGVFTAHAVGRMQRFKPFVLWTGIFQRLAYLGAALVLLLSEDRVWCLAAVALAPLLSGLAGGVSATAWQQLVAATVPPARRSSLFAWRYVLSSLLGVAAGWVVATTLAASPGLRGYGLLHLWALAGLVLSYVVFLLVREPAAAARTDPPTGMWDNVRGMPGLLWSDRRLLRFLAAAALAALAGGVIPYLAIHARHVCAAPESFLGELVSWQMGGAIAGCVLAGWAGDRHGGKLPLQAGRLAVLAVCLLAPWLQAAWSWHLLFLLFGAGSSAAMVGANTLQLEILPAHGRTNRLALIGICQLPVMVAASLAGGGVWQAMGEGAFLWLALAGALGSLLAVVVLAPLPEPRRSAA